MRGVRAPSELRTLSAAGARACGANPQAEPAGDVDWDEVLRLADRHQVAGLAHRGLQDTAPATVRAALAERAQAVAFGSLHRAALQRRVTRAVEAATVPFVVLKGLPLAVDAYGDPVARHARDVDLLVAPQDARRAVQALQADGLAWYGWRRPEDADRPDPDAESLDRLERLPMLRDVTLVDETGVGVELHWRLFENARLLPVDPRWLDAPRLVEVHGEDVPTPPLAAHLAYVLVHGTKHVWSLMKWLADVPALMLRHPELTRRESLAAASQGNERAVATGLLVAEATFGRFLPTEARAWAHAARGTRVLVRHSLAALAAPHDRPKMVTPRTLSGEVATRLALRGDVAYRRDELRLLLLTAGRGRHVEDPGAAELAAAPLRWARRATRRRRSTTPPGP